MLNSNVSFLFKRVAGDAGGLLSRGMGEVVINAVEGVRGAGSRLHLKSFLAAAMGTVTAFGTPVMAQAAMNTEGVVGARVAPVAGYVQGMEKAPEPTLPKGFHVVSGGPTTQPS